MHTEVREGDMCTQRGGRGTCVHRGEGGGHLHTEVREGDKCTQR